MSHYALSKEAALDLEEIWDFIAADNLSAADRWSAKLLQACATLGKNPGLGHKRSDLTALPILFWPVGSYLILYRIQNATVEILAVTLGERDIPTVLSQRLS